MNVAVVGSNGQLGTDLVKVAREQGHDVLELTHTDIQVEDRDFDFDWLEFEGIEAVINTAAIHDLQKCEADPVRAYEVNVALPLVEYCRRHDLYYLYVSTDYVFDGVLGTYHENAGCWPLSVYGRTKLAGEMAVRTQLHRLGAICRVSGLFGAAECRGKQGGNLVDKIVAMVREGKQASFDTDTWFSPTYTHDGAEQIMRVLIRLANGESGVFHCANEGRCSHWTFAWYVAMALGSDWGPEMRSGETALLRPKMSALDNLRMPVAPAWRDAVDRYIAEKYGKEA